MFDPPLAPDPAIALKPISLTPLRVGPLPKVQLVIELVGPRTVPAASAKFILDSRWAAALGHPETYCMSAADSSWRVLEGTDSTGAYDSLALAWDILSERGELSQASADHLLATAETFAQQIQRRAMSMPTPAEIPNLAKRLATLRENLDIGLSLYVHSRTAAFSEDQVWRACAALGLDLSPEGIFEWRTPDWPHPLLGIGPTDHDRFSLAAVKAGTRHDLLEIGFSLPRSPAPREALEACLHCGRYLATTLGGVLTDDSDQELTEKRQHNLRATLDGALDTLAKAGLPAGSREALKIFPVETDR